MTAATRVSGQAQDYLTAVERELADLSAEDRSALLEDLALHLDALATEDDDRPLVVRLGPAAAYAADLRAAAGLPVRGAVAGASAVGLRQRLETFLASPFGRRVAAGAEEVWRLVRELRPAWWVLRGYLAVLVPCQLISDWVRDFPVPAPLGSNELGALLVLVAIAGSVALGRRTVPRALGMVIAAGGVLLVLVAASAAMGVRQDLEGKLNAAAWAPGPQVPDETYPLLSRYGPVTDVFPYAADGTPLEGVLLYDQDGRPLHVGFQEWWADQCARVLEQPRAADGVPVPNSFPQSYELSGGGVNQFGDPMAAGVCVQDPPRPAVPLPTFPPGSTVPAAGG